MKKKIVSALLAATVLLTGCSGGGTQVAAEDALNGLGAESETGEKAGGATEANAPLLVPASAKADPATLPDPALSGNLTLSVCWDYYYIEDAVQRFQDLHPDVSIELNHYHSDYEKYTSNIDAQLMSKTADDIIDGGGLNFLKYSGSGALADFVPLMNNDPRFYPEEYYQNALTGMAYEGGIYAFPINFDFDLAAINSVVGEGAMADFTSNKTVTMAQLMDYYDQYGPENGLYTSMNLSASIVATRALNDFIDIEAKISKLNSPAFVQMIDTAAKGIDPEMEGSLFGSNFYGMRFDEYNAETQLYRLTSPDNMEYFMPFEREMGNLYYSAVVPVGFENGNVRIESSKNFFISENSQNKELAWEFIKFLTTLEGAEGVWHPAMPIKRDVAEKHLREQMDIIVNQFYEEEYAGRFTLTEEVMQQALADVGKVTDMPMEMVLEIESEIFYEEMPYIRNGAKTAEQVAETIHNKIALYLME